MIIAEYVPSTGHDLRVVNSARVSFNRHVDELRNEDIRLINYMARHNHFTPFTHSRYSFVLPRATVAQMLMDSSPEDVAGAVWADTDLGVMLVRNSLWGWSAWLRSGKLDGKWAQGIASALSLSAPHSCRALGVYVDPATTPPAGVVNFPDDYVDDSRVPDFIDVTLRETVPVFVARQRFKHTVGFTYNEISRRYWVGEPQFYDPGVWRKRAENVKQGSSDEPVWITPSDGFCLQCRKPLVVNRACEAAKKRYCSSVCQQRHDKVRNYPRYRLRHWKTSAQKRGLDFDLTIQDVTFPEMCPYLETPLDYESDKAGPMSPSLDRIDPTKGYVKGNVQVISNLANTMKNSADKDTLMRFVKNAALMHGGVIMPSADTVSRVFDSMKAVYLKALADGVAPEQARMFLPQATMTSYYVTGSLSAFARAYKLRSSPDAQVEIRVLAEQWHRLIQSAYPVTWTMLVG